MRSLTYYVGVTLDGFIAAPDGSTDVFPVEEPVLDFITAEFPETLPTHVRGPLGVSAPGTSFDTVVMGRATYATALAVGITSPYAHLRQVVVSTTLPTDVDAQVEVVAADPVARVRRLKQEPGAGIWLAGGGTLAGALLDEIDELVLKRYPVVLGAGIGLLNTGEPRPLPFALTGARTLHGGTTVSTYRRIAHEQHPEPTPATARAGSPCR